MNEKEVMMDSGGERKIPVFTVLKNGVILKNIFVVNNPDSSSPERIGDGDDHEVEEILVVGRHPDCNIVLTHPSVSRLHLEIRSIPSRQRLSVVDLFSVHGTWVSDQKAEPGTCVEVKEGDTIKIGGSTRIYRLHWIPLRRAYDTDNPFVSLIDIYAAKQQEEENEIPESENVEITHEDADLVPGEDETRQLDWTSKEAGSIIPSEDQESFLKETSSLSSASPTKLQLFRDSPEMGKHQFCEETHVFPSLVTSAVEGGAEYLRTSCLASKLQNHGSLKASSSSLFAQLDEDDTKSLQGKDYGETEVGSRKAMEVSAGLSDKTDHLLEVEAKDIQGLLLGCQLLPKAQGEVVNEGDSQTFHLEDNDETEIVSNQVMAVSAQPFTATEPLLETNTKVIQGPLFGWQMLSKIQDELVQEAGNQCLHQEDDREMEIVPRQVVAVSSCSLPEAEPLSEIQSERAQQADSQSLHEEPDSDIYAASMEVMAVSSCSLPVIEPRLETKTEDIQGVSLGWQTLPEIQSELADNRSLHQEDIVKTEVFAGPDMAASFPETEGLLQTTNKEIQEPFSVWDPLCEIHSELKLARNWKQDLGIAGEDDGQFDEANSLILSKGHEHTELWCSLSATNLNSNVEHCKSAMGTGYGGESEGAYHVSKLESCQNKEEMGLDSTTSDSEESANLSQPAEEIFSDVNQTLQVHARVLSGSENLKISPLEPTRTSSRCNILADKEISIPVLQTPSKRSASKARKAGDNCTDQSQKKEVMNDKSILVSLHAGSEKLEPEIFTPDKENLTPNTHALKRLQKIDDYGESKGSSKFKSRTFSSKVSSSNGIVPSRVILEPEIFTPDKENLTPNTHFLKRLQEVSGFEKSTGSSKIKSRPLSSKISSSNIVASKEVRERKMFTLDKESLIPSYSMLKRLQEAGKPLENMESSNPRQKPFSSSDIDSDEYINSMENKNQSPVCSARSKTNLKQDQVVQKSKTERAPFQSLLEHSSVRSEEWKVEPSSTASLSRSPSILSDGKNKSKWTIVVDTSSLLDRESMKSLQLLQGLKGTQLVIPETVLRELNERKQCHSLFFRRPSQIVSSALEWIQECMATTKWWIHLQRSSDQTSKDSALQCALLRQKRVCNGQLVLLSNDATLMIKAMAEGIMCETAQEFQQSLMNPYSERFMWKESRARGRTWCHPDDVALRERYNKYNSDMTKKPLKGLKLILLHNSHYPRNLFSSSPAIVSLSRT